MRAILGSKRFGFWAIVAMFFVAANPSFALINLNYTPVNLVRSSDAIVVCDATVGSEADSIKLRAVNLLKGKALGFDKIDVSEFTDDDDFSLYLEEDKFRVVIFTGDFSQAGKEKKTKAIGAMHLGNVWFSLKKNSDGKIELREDKLDLKAVWDGGSGPLCRLVKYVQTSRSPRIPASSGVKWREVQVLGKITGKLGAPALACGDDGVDLLYPCSDGDVLVRTVKGKATINRLNSRSALATRVDLNGDGSGDWIGYDGKRLYFAKVGKGIEKIVSNLPGVLDMTPVTVKGKPALLAITEGGPVFVEKTGNGFATSRPLAEKLRDIRAGLMLDTDSDGLSDLVLAAGKKLFVATAKKGGGFNQPRNVLDLYDMKLTRMLPADFDADGCLDLLMVGDDQQGVDLLAGDGKGRFSGAVMDSGEMNYHGQKKMQYAAIGDINNDGLLDVLFTPTGASPIVMFNRGFRSFGFARELDFGVTKVKGVESVAGGDGEPRVSRSAIFVDLDRDGAQDLVFQSGDELVCVRRAVTKKELSVRVRLAEGLAGPVSVTAAPLGGQVSLLQVDSAGLGLVGKRSKGPLNVSWTFPDGKTGKKRLIVLKATTLTIGR